MIGYTPLATSHSLHALMDNIIHPPSSYLIYRKNRPVVRRRHIAMIAVRYLGRYRAGMFVREDPVYHPTGCR